MLGTATLAERREQALMQDLEAALAVEIELRGLAHKLKDDVTRWSAECEKWKKLASAGNSNSNGTSSNPGTNDQRFRKIKALLSKALHPDDSKDAREIQIKTKLFQELWPKILDVEKGA